MPTCPFRFSLLPGLFLGLAALPLRAESATQPEDLFAGDGFPALEYVVSPATPLASVCTRQADGVIAVVGKPVGYLATKSTYSNYRLHVEWRWPADAAKNSNGGVLLHIASGPVGGTAWPVCFQMQLKPTRAGDLLPMGDAAFADKLSTPPGARTPQLNRREEASEKPLGEWNACDITCRDGTIEVTVNGVRQNQVTGATPGKGRVGFQLEGTPFELRNVRLTTL